MVRTTLTLEDDVAEELERASRSSGRDMEATVNRALRKGLGLEDKSALPPRFEIRTFLDGLRPDLDPDKMNQLLDQLEAENVASKLRG